MEEIRKGWKKWASWISAAIIVVIVYKMLDNYSSIKAWIGGFLSILTPFLVGLLISFVLLTPCRKIEGLYKKSKIKFISKRYRGFGVITTFIIFILLLILLINVIFPILRDSVVELVNNIPNYYNTVVREYDKIPEDSFLKSDIIQNKMNEFKNIDVSKILNISSDQIFDYIKNIINIFTGLFDVFVSLIVSVYILLQRTQILNALRRFNRAIFKKSTYEAIDKYFINANETILHFISSQLLDAIVVGILTTAAMMLLDVKYAPLLGFIIGLFNMIPYIGAIVAVIIAIIVTLITGGFGQALVMAIVVTILQQIDANIINPKIIGTSLKVSPLLVLLAITIFGAYFGIVGMFLGVPIMVVIKTILNDYVEHRNKIKDEEEKIIETEKKTD